MDAVAYGVAAAAIGQITLQGAKAREATFEGVAGRGSIPAMLNAK